MNIFLKRVFLFILPIAVVLSILEYKIQQLDNSYKVKSQYLNANVNSIETLILGSSHTFYGLDPKFFTSKTFNASNVSQSPDVDFAILKSYEDMLDNLSTVVIRLSYDTLFEQLKDSPEDWRLKDYRLYTDIDFNYKLKHNSEILSTGTHQVLKILKAYYYDGKPLLNSDSLGWGNNLSNRPKPDLNKAGLSAAKRHTAKSWDLLQDNIDKYRAIIEWCSNRNAQVIIVTLPAYKSYRNNLNKEQLNKMLQVGNLLDSEFKNCSYFNFMDEESFIAEDFYDADHLSANGAQKFSLIINSLIEN